MDSIFVFQTFYIYFFAWHYLSLHIGLTEITSCIKVKILHSATKLSFCSLLVTFCSLLVIFCSLLITFCSLLVTSGSLLVTFCSLLVTFCSLLVTFCSLIFTRCSLLFARYFCVWCKSRELGGKKSPRFPSVTPVVEGFSSDLLQAVIRYWADSHLESCQTSTMELCCENNQQL